MELDDLRRQWQQPAATPPPLSPGQLDGLLSRRSGGLVEKMRTNARLETGLTVLLAVGMPFGFWRADTALHKLEAGFLFLVALGMLGYYYRKLNTLRQMAETGGNVRSNLQRLCAGLRDLLRFYYRLTLASGPASLLLMYGYMVGKELARPEGPRSKLLLITGGVLLVLGLLLQWAVIHGTRWYLQQLYGRHLDRLEAALQELGEQ
ncbi:hypothetical protein LJY25_15645 [Hymenobacter sp. BT175]|uniref:hypothetical protein n=1 Tax=Hymenobacter translucens TaxID=2886507 RepID=UPI001D0DC69B|nr:hypothetical protein [Hymenobacter translucens]MCC2547883.1 hypothetical protein [Hymenobacter translucens]